MIHYVLACVLWAKPNVDLVEVPVGEYGTATMQKDFGNFIFEGTVIEEHMNSVKITYKKSESSAESYAPTDPLLKSLSIRLIEAQDEATLDCEVKVAPENNKGT